MRRRGEIPASVLPTVLVVSVVMLIIILGLLALWDFNFLMFSRSDHVRKKQADIESFYTLYKNDAVKVMDDTGADSVFRLYEEDHSALKVAVRSWGLYEAVSVSSLCGKVSATRLFGLELAGEDDAVLWYRNSGSALTITGKTEIHGPVRVPANGIIYGQMQSEFFSGTPLPPVMIDVSGDEFPHGDAESTGMIEELFLAATVPDGSEVPVKLEAGFRAPQPVQVFVHDELPAGCDYKGMVLVCGDRLTVREDSRLQDVLLVANYIEIEDGVRGRFQCFARDSVVIGGDVLLDFPSGIYSRHRIRLGENSIVNGYVINDFEGEINIMEPNTVKPRSSKVRGLFYSRGISVVQGITTGCAYIEDAVYYSPHGYYRNFLYEAAFLGNESVAYPLWLGREGRRKEAGW